jgi:hypothetical protein
MKSVSAKTAKNSFGLLLDTAMAEPVLMKSTDEEWQSSLPLKNTKSLKELRKAPR